MRTSSAGCFGALLIALTSCGGVANSDGGASGGATSGSGNGGVTSGGSGNGGAPNSGGASGESSSGGVAGCTVGADQTCNDDPRVSSLWGHCERGVCQCNMGLEINPATGKCRVPAEPQDDTISLARGICFGGCPVYKIRIDADGTVSYVGDRYVRVHGAATRQIDPSAVSALAGELEAAGYFDIVIPDDCELSTDSPTVTTSLTRHGRTHEVAHYLGNSCAPPVLPGLEARIDAVAGTSEWIDCVPERFCQEP